MTPRGNAAIFWNVFSRRLFAVSSRCCRSHTVYLRSADRYPPVFPYTIALSLNYVYLYPFININLPNASLDCCLVVVLKAVLTQNVSFVVILLISPSNPFYCFVSHIIISIYTYLSIYTLQSQVQRVFAMLLFKLFKFKKFFVVVTFLFFLFFVFFVSNTFYSGHNDRQLRRSHDRPYSGWHHLSRRCSADRCLSPERKNDCGWLFDGAGFSLA